MISKRKAMVMFKPHNNIAIDTDIVITALTQEGAEIIQYTMRKPEDLTAPVSVKNIIYAEMYGQ